MVGIIMNALFEGFIYRNDNLVWFAVLVKV